MTPTETRTIDKKDPLFEVFKYLYLAIGKGDKWRPALGFIKVECKAGKIIATATDGVRLHRIYFPSDFKLLENANYLKISMFKATTMQIQTFDNIEYQFPDCDRVFPSHGEPKAMKNPIIENHTTIVCAITKQAFDYRFLVDALGFTSLNKKGQFDGLITYYEAELGLPPVIYFSVRVPVCQEPLEITSLVMPLRIDW